MKACLDACVLVPTALRGILIRMAEAGAYEPKWSARIFEEWTRADLKINSNASLAVEHALLKDKWRSATVEENKDLESMISLPDKNDVHVLATAVAARADVLVTANLRDFPVSAVSRFGISLRHPDAFLLELSDQWGEELLAAVTKEYQLAREATGENFTLRAFMKRIALPRIAKRMDS